MSERLVIRNAAQVVCISGTQAQVRRGAEMQHLSVIADGAVVVNDGKIAWVGQTKDLALAEADTTIINASGKTVLPGFIDSHTHLVFAGSREAEFEQRLEGRTYQEIAASGGGINATVHKVRQSSKEQLKAEASKRIARLLRFGVTTIEVKSGYGLSYADEIKCLEVVAELNEEGPWELVPTFLGAHAIPLEFRANRAEYVDLLIQCMLPEIAHRHLAEFCDVFCDDGAFTPKETEAIFTQAQKLGFQLKLHADELTALGGAEIAARYGATSADHLLCVTEAGIDALAKSSTIATLLPGTAFFLGVSYAPARKMIDRGLAVAVASDCNPGTCPTENLPLVGSMACTQMRMLLAEVGTALTLNAAGNSSITSE